MTLAACEIKKSVPILEYEGPIVTILRLRGNEREKKQMSPIETLLASLIFLF